MLLRSDPIRGPWHAIPGDELPLLNLSPDDRCALVTWFSARSSDFQIIKGEPRRYDSTEQGVRSFCSRCGTQLTSKHADFPDEIDVTTSSLDGP